VTEWIYRISAKRGRVAAIGTPPRPPSLRADRVAWDMPESELGDVTVLRRWLREHKVRGVEEGGRVKQTNPLPSSGEPYSMTAVPWTPWRGPALTRDAPCKGCGLRITIVTPPSKVISSELIDNVLEALAEAPLCFLPAPTCLITNPDVVEAVRSAGLDEGLTTHPRDHKGRALLIGSDSAIGGPAYPYGPPPCGVCGRATRRAGDRLEFVRPNYAYELSFEASITHWSWSTVYGQVTPLVSHEVAELLLEIMPFLKFTPHGRPDAPGAFLPERYQ
jgi:hypothetical protein